MPYRLNMSGMNEELLLDPMLDGIPIPAFKCNWIEITLLLV